MVWLAGMGQRGLFIRGGWLILAACMAIISSQAQAGDSDVPELRGPYFGQTPPGENAVIFAPETLSVTGRYEYALSFSPAGDRLLVTVQPGDDDVFLLHSRMRNGVWTSPERVELSAGARQDEMEAFFAPDGKHVYFSPYDEGMDVQIWEVEIDGDLWRNPRPLEGAIADEPAFYPTCSRDGRLYTFNLGQRKTFISQQGEDGSWDAQPAGLEFGAHAFIAPDESFVLLNARGEDSLGKSDIYVAFADGQGWTPPVNLGEGVNSSYSETCPSLSADGKYIFFSRYNEEGEKSQIYWVDRKVIEKVRPVDVQAETELINEIVHNSLAWAVCKDVEMLESIIAHDEDYFSFHPEGLVGVHGYEEFQQGYDIWLDSRFVALPPEMRDFRCHFSKSGEVAWFSAIVDDCYTWDDQPGCWKDTRWTGVLEKQDGEWKIMQMHFSFASDVRE